MKTDQLTVLFLLSLSLAACSSDSNDNGGQNEPLPPQQEETDGQPDDGTDAIPGTDEDGGATDGEQPTDGEVPSDDTPPADGENPTDDENADETPTDGEPPVDVPPASTLEFMLIGPSGGVGGIPAYSQFNDSPFANIDFSSGYFHFENFEDGLLENPGAMADGGEFTSAVGINFHDSVDEDDGLIDGNSLQGDSWFRGFGTTSVQWTFDAAQLGGNLPTHAGLVWTDGRGDIEFEAFGAQGESLGVVSGDHADRAFDGGTDEDRFYGVVNPAGISSIRISTSDTSFGLEIDHLQWGFIDQ